MTSPLIPEYDRFVAALLAKGVPREKAEAVARENLGIPAPSALALEERREKEEQRACWKIFRAHGCEVFWLSQARASKQTPGLADMFVFAPRYNAAWWFETKRPVGGIQSKVQQRFEELCHQCGVRYIIGGQAEAYAILREIGAITP